MELLMALTTWTVGGAAGYLTHAAAGSLVAAGFGLGLALASAPGPVQAIVLDEALRGGVGRGLAAVAGANLTFGLLVVAAALGFSLAPPSGALLRLLKLAGGGYLLWVAFDAVRSTVVVRPANRTRSVPPPVRTALAVVLNPGSWLFLGTAASSLLSSAAGRAGTTGAVGVALCLMAGLAVGDVTVAVVGGTGVRRAGVEVERFLRLGLAAVLAALGIWLVLNALVP
jgi:threonine/homoserine/homoserine lactone efflux protein